MKSNLFRRFVENPEKSIIRTDDGNASSTGLHEDFTQFKTLRLRSAEIIFWIRYAIIAHSIL